MSDLSSRMQELILAAPTIGVNSAWVIRESKNGLQYFSRMTEGVYQSYGLGKTGKLWIKVGEVFLKCNQNVIDHDSFITGGCHTAIDTKISS